MEELNKIVEHSIELIKEGKEIIKLALE